MPSKTSLLFACILGFTLRNLTAAEDFLPATTEAQTFVGTQWREGDSKDRPLRASVIVHEMAKGEWGRAVEVRVRVADRSRDIPSMQWVVTPQGAIYEVGFGEAHADVKEWAKGSAQPKLSADDLRLPAMDTEEGGFMVPEKPKEETEDGWPISTRHESVTWSRGAVENSIRLNPARDVARYNYFHGGNSNFSTVVWQRGVGIVRLSMGDGAHRDGYQLDRVYPPAPKPPPNPDVAQLFVFLPREAMPSLGALAVLAESSARKHLIEGGAEEKPEGIGELNLDRARGYLSVGSNGDGEGDTLEAAMWKRKNGSRLIALHIKHWTAGPSATQDVRLYEFANGQFRLATFSDWHLPEAKDFMAVEESHTNEGSFIAGDWGLPRQGTTIVIRPALEDDADMLGEEVKCDDAYAFELTWNGNEFETVRIPRLVPPPEVEPSEWIMQLVRNEGAETSPMTLLLRRSGDHFTGELRESGKKTLQVTAAFHRENDRMDFAIKGDGKSIATDGRLAHAMGEEGWNGLAFESDLGREALHVFSPVPVGGNVREVPRFGFVADTKTQKGADVAMHYPVFDLPTVNAADWRAINSACAALAAREKAAFLKAVGTMDVPTLKNDPPSLSFTPFVESVRANSVSVRFIAVSALGSVMNSSRPCLNYDLAHHRLMKLGDLLVEGWPEKLAGLVNAEMIKQDLASEGQEPVSAEYARELNWTLSADNELLIHLAERELSPNSVQAELRIKFETLNEAGLIRPSGALGAE